MINIDKNRRFLVILLIAILVVVPFPLQSGNTYILTLLIRMLTLGLFAVAFNLLFGYSGLLSFGHAAYYGLGAYAFAISLSMDLPLIGIDSFFGAILVAVLVAAISAAVFGAMAVQRKDIFFAMLTLAFSMMVYYPVRQLDDITGGTDGTIVSATNIDLGIIVISTRDTFLYYYVTLFLVLLVLLALWRVTTSPYGELLLALGENPERAAFVGIPVKLYQWSAFVLSGAVAGLAGGLAAVQLFVVSPEILHWSTSAEPILITLIGGPSSFIGPLVGAIVFVGLEEVILNFTQHWEIVLGLIFIPLVLFSPGGIVGSIETKLSGGQPIPEETTSLPQQEDET